MCSAKVVAVDKKESDEEDESFERVDRPETTEAEDGNTLELLMAAMEESKLHHAEFMKEMERRRRSKNKLAVVYGILLAAYAVYIAANHLATPATPSTSTPPPVTSPASECPQAPECPKSSNLRRSIRFEYRFDKDGTYLPIPFQFGFQDGFVSEVEPNSNAQLAGLEVGDQILKVNDIDLENKEDRLIFLWICSDNKQSLFALIYRRLTGYKPEHCGSMTRFMADKGLHIEVRRNVRAYVKAQKLRCFLVGCVMTTLLAAIISFCVWNGGSDSSRAKLIKSCSEKAAKINKQLAPKTTDRGGEEKEKNLRSMEKEDEADQQDMKEELREFISKTLKAEEDRLLAMCFAREEERKKRALEKRHTEENNSSSWENGTWPKAD